MTRKQKLIEKVCDRCASPRVLGVTFCQKHLKEEYDRYFAGDSYEKDKQATSNERPKVEHTPTPWQVKSLPGRKVGDTCRNWIHAGDMYIAEVGDVTMPEHVANAEFIVRAVNSHEALLKVAKAVVAYQRGYGPSKTLGELVNMAIQAITQAEQE